MYHKTFKVHFIKSKHEPLRRGQPLYKGQKANPESVLSSEVFLYLQNLMFHSLVYPSEAYPEMRVGGC